MQHTLTARGEAVQELSRAPARSAALAVELGEQAGRGRVTGS